MTDDEKRKAMPFAWGLLDRLVESELKDSRWREDREEKYED